MDDLDRRISGERLANQTYGYSGMLLFPPLLIATEGSYSEKTELDRLQAARDRLLALRAIKACTGEITDPATGRINTLAR